MQRVGMLNGNNINHDKDFTAGLLAMLNPGVIEGLAVSGSGASANITAGKALIECTRSNGEKVMVFFENTANVSVDLTGTKKVYILVDQGKLDDGSSNAEDGTGVASIQTGASWPSGSYIKVASTVSGTITDERILLSEKNILRKGFGSGNIIDFVGGDEVVKTISASSTMSDSDILRIKNSDGSWKEVLYSVVKNTLSSAGKFLQNIAMGESLGSGIWAISIVSNHKKMDFVYTSQASGVSNKLDGPGEIVSVAWSHNVVGGWDATYLRGSNDGTNWTELGNAYYHDSNQTSGTFTPTAGSIYRYIKIERGGRTFTYTVYTNQQGIGQIMMKNTLGSDISGSRVKSGIVFRPKVTDVLGRLYTSQNATSTSARVQVYNIDGTTLVAEKTPTVGLDYVDFPEIVTRDTDYIVCVNDSSYFNAQNNELILASYQVNNPYCVSGYLNGATNVNPQNIRRIDFASKKGMKSIANSTNEFANFSGFANGTKSIGDLVELNGNEYTYIEGFSGLTVGDVLYVSNTAGVPSATKGTIKSPIGQVLSATSIILRKIVLSIDTLISYSLPNAGIGVTNYGAVGWHYGGLLSYTLSTSTTYIGATMTLQWSIDGVNNWKDVVSASGNQTLTGSMVLPTGYIRGKQVSQNSSNASSILVTN